MDLKDYIYIYFFSDVAFCCCALQTVFALSSCVRHPSWERTTLCSLPAMGVLLNTKAIKKKSFQTEIQFKNKRSLFPQKKEEQKKLNVLLSPICWASTMAFSWEAAGWWTAENRMSLLHTGPHGLQHIESDTGYIMCLLVIRALFKKIYIKSSSWGYLNQ